MASVLLLHASLNENSVNVISCFRRICLILQTINYRDNEKYVQVLVQCHDGIIMNSINQIYLVRDNPIITLDSNHILIIHTMDEFGLPMICFELAILVQGCIQHLLQAEKCGQQAAILTLRPGFVQVLEVLEST